MRVLMLLLVVAGTVLLARGLAARGWMLDVDDQQALLQPLAVAVATLPVAEAMPNRPLWLATAAAMAWLPTVVVQWPPLGSRLTAACGGRHEATAVGWVVVAAVAVAGPSITTPTRITMPVFRGVAAMTAIYGIAMLGRQAQETTCNSNNTEPTSTDG